MYILSTAYGAYALKEFLGAEYVPLSFSQPVATLMFIGCMISC
jgi:hypothetical protein